MRRAKAKRLVELVRVGAALVRGKLDQAAAALTAFLDRPFNHRPAETTAAFVPGDAHPLDLAAPHAAPGQPGNEAELQNPDDVSAAFRDGEKLVRIALDRGECLAVAVVQPRPGVLAPAAQPLTAAMTGFHTRG